MRHNCDILKENTPLGIVVSFIYLTCSDLYVSCNVELLEVQPSLEECVCSRIKLQQESATTTTFLWTETTVC